MIPKYLTKVFAEKLHCDLFYKIFAENIPSIHFPATEAKRPLVCRSLTLAEGRPGATARRGPPFCFDPGPAASEAQHQPSPSLPRGRPLSLLPGPGPGHLGRAFGPRPPDPGHRGEKKKKLFFKEFPSDAQVSALRWIRPKYGPYKPKDHASF